MAAWPFSKKPSQPRQPEFEDKALCELSQMFLSNPGDPTPGSELLEVATFDFSVDSLKALDEHLERMRTRELDDRGWKVLTLRAGAYVGEVIRRHTPKPREWHWLGYKRAAERIPFVASLGMSIGTAAVLCDENDGVVFPCAKVGKLLQNGPEDSTWFYAQVIIAGPPPTA